MVQSSARLRTTRRSPVLSAFTLIELLVVIAIIAILAAILFPVFAQARDKARASVCLTHAREIGTAVVMYAQDYDEMLVPGATGTWPNTATYRHFNVLLDPYIKNQDVWTCPSGRTDATRKLSIGMNKYVAAMMYFVNIGYPAVPMSSMEYPAECIVMSEIPATPHDGSIASYNGQLSFGQSYGACLAYLTAVGITGAYSPNVQHYLRHQGGSMYIFGDGHAKWLKPERTFAPYTLWFRNRPSWDFPMPTRLPGAGGCSSLNKTRDI